MVFDVYLSLGMISTAIPQATAISRNWVSVVKYSSPVVRLKLKIRVDSNSVNRVNRCLEALAEFPSPLWYVDEPEDRVVDNLSFEH